MKKSYKYSLLLILCSVIWGSAFVAQSTGMDYVGPFTFNGIRCIVGTLVLIPVANFFNKRSEHSSKWTDKELIKGGLICGIFLFLASSSQQIGLQYTTVGKSGFITSFYIVVVPVLALVLKKKPSPFVWVSVVLSMVGLYFLCMTEGFSFAAGDLWTLACAFLFAGQILAVDYFAPKVNTVKLSCLQFAVTAILSIIPMIFEKPVASNLLGCTPAILYAGVLSCGVAYTLQIVGQREVKPEIASILMSLESVFSVVFGFLLLHQKLSYREAIGCVLMFFAVIIAQLAPVNKSEKEA